MSQIDLENFGAYQKARNYLILVVTDMAILKTPRVTNRHSFSAHRRGTPWTPFAHGKGDRQFMNFALNFNPVILPTDQALVEYVRA